VVELAHIETNDFGNGGTPRMHALLSTCVRSAWKA
jgi:hypothetical protein